MGDGWDSIDTILSETMQYAEVLGAVAVSREGLVVGSAGMAQGDADLVGAIGASLIGAAERTARRLGAGVADDISLHTSDGAIHVRSGGDFAVLLFTERCDTAAVADVCAAAVRRIGSVLAVA